MSEELVYWVASAIALVGVWFNIRHHVACFYLWACTNAVWVYADASHGLVSQAILQGVYFALSLYGIREWSRRRPVRNGHCERSDPAS